MRGTALLMAAALISFASGCAPKHQPGTGVSAGDFDLNPLVGVWRGTYSNPQTGRNGTIAFSLRAGESFASGNVVMIPKADSLLTPEERELVNEVLPSGRAVLPIKFVRKEGGSLNGTLDPYRSPDCDCTVNTTFEGTFKDSATLAGTFTTVPSKAGAAVTSGVWQAIRVKKL
jgi:hypothetical protein